MQILREAPELDTYPGGAPNIDTTLEGFDAGDRWITVSLEGGSFDWPKIAQARVDVNCFAESSLVAQDLAQTALAILWREMGQPSPDFGVRTCNIKVETGMVRADDKLTDSARYLFALRISYVPYQGA